MEVRISARFRSKKAPIADFAKDTGFRFALKKWMKRANEAEGFFMATTGDTEVSSLTETVALVTRLYDGILASPRLAGMITDKWASGDVWVVSFGQECPLEDEISSALMGKIERSRVSLFLENYPLVEDKNPHGHFVVHFE